MIIQARIDFNSHIIREIFITACWVLWKARNGIIFDNQTATLLKWRESLKEELGQICIKAKKSISDPCLYGRRTTCNLLSLLFWALTAL